MTRDTLRQALSDEVLDAVYECLKETSMCGVSPRDRDDARAIIIAAVLEPSGTPERDHPDMGILNRICHELGLFDGARADASASVLHGEIIPAIRAIKANNPEAAVFVDELQRARKLWTDALMRLVEARREETNEPGPGAEPKGKTVTVREWFRMNRAPVVTGYDWTTPSRDVLRALSAMMGNREDLYQVNAGILAEVMWSNALLLQATARQGWFAAKSSEDNRIDRMLVQAEEAGVRLDDEYIGLCVFGAQSLLKTVTIVETGEDSFTEELNGWLSRRGELRGITR